MHVVEEEEGGEEEKKREEEQEEDAGEYSLPVYRGFRSGGLNIPLP